MDDIIDSELPPLQFPEDNFWNAFVTVANSTIEIWLRIIGPQYSVSEISPLFLITVSTDILVCDRLLF